MDPVSESVLRPATIEDAESLLEWANYPDSLSNKAATTVAIDRRTHYDWLEARLVDESCRLCIIESGGTPVGQVRLELKSGGYHVDIFIVPAYRRAGVARSALQKAISVANLRPVIAIVRAGNEPSISLFRSLGFVESGRQGDFITYCIEE